MVSNRTKTLANSGLIVGLLAGAAAAFFLAPRKGKQTQKILALKANEITQKTIVAAQDSLLKFEKALEDNQSINQVEYEQVKHFDL